MSVGGRGMRYSVHSSGRRTTSVGLPGTGLSYVTTKGGGSRRSGKTRMASVQASAVPGATKPGWFAPKAEKDLYKIVKSGMDVDALDQAAEQYPSHRYTAIALSAVKRMEADREPDVAVRQVREVIGNGYNPETDSFAQRYLPFISASVGVPGFPVARLPYSRGLLALGASGILLKQGNQEEALKLATYLQDSLAGQILLAELYEQCGQPKRVLELTDNVDNEDEASMLLLTLRGKALAKSGHLGAALETFKEALRYRSRPDELKELAWLNRAKAYIDAGKLSQARKDLERIMAEDSSYPGLEELMYQVEDGKSAHTSSRTRAAASTNPTSVRNKVGGEIGYHHLEDWWFTAFTEENRKYITEKFQPMGVSVGEGATSNNLTEGDITWSSTSASNFLNGLSSWFVGPNDRVIGRKIGEKAKEEALESKDPLDMHFALSSLITLYYRDRDQADYYKKALAYCRAQIKIQAVAARAFKKEYPQQPLPAHVGYEQLAIVLEKEKRYQETVDLAKEAKQSGWSGDWDRRIERCLKRLQAQNG